MKIGIGLPGHVPELDGRVLVEWARRAEARGFSTLSVSDRLVWSTPEPLAVLAAAAAATERIGLLSTVLIAPLHSNHALFAAQAASIDQLAGPGRLRLGLAPGLRTDDFAESKIDFPTRGRQFDELLHRTAEIWAGSTAIGPAPATPGGPALLFGGTSAATLRRVVGHGTGWVAGDASVADIEAFAPRVRQAWTATGRQGSPSVVASIMFALGLG